MKHQKNHFIIFSSDSYSLQLGTQLHISSVFSLSGDRRLKRTPENVTLCQPLNIPVKIFANVSHQTRLDTRSKARRPIKVGIKGRGRPGTRRDPAGLCCSSAHLVQCEPDEASSFTNPNVGPGTYAGLWFELDSKV